MAEIIPLEKFKLYQSTLQEMHLEITERLFPFITFNIVDANENAIASQTIPWARFREVEGRPDLYEVRSNDCDVTPRHVLYLSKKIMSRYIYTEKNDDVYYAFTYFTGVQ